VNRQVTKLGQLYNESVLPAVFAPMLLLKLHHFYQTTNPSSIAGGSTSSGCLQVRTGTKQLLEVSLDLCRNGRCHSATNASKLKSLC
jgi:hypothetical protein